MKAFSKTVAERAAIDADFATSLAAEYQFKLSPGEPISSTDLRLVHEGAVHGDTGWGVYVSALPKKTKAAGTGIHSGLPKHSVHQAQAAPSAPLKSGGNLSEQDVAMQDIPTPCTSCEAALNGRCVVIAPNQPIVTTERVDGMEIMTIRILDAGSILPQHQHSYDHATVLASGSVTVTRADRTATDYSAPATILIPAHTMHAFETHEPDTVLLCIHNTSRTGRVEVEAENALPIVEAA